MKYQQILDKLDARFLVKCMDEDYRSDIFEIQQEIEWLFPEK